MVLAPLRPPPVPSVGVDPSVRAATLAALHGLDRSHPSSARTALDLLLEYVDGLPRVALSRCPLTGEETVYPIDTAGLDGPWWDYELPARPDERLAPTVHVVTGAMALAPTIEPTDWIVRPGPGVPFVVPHLLERDDVVAVVSELPIGRHRGFPVVYYSTSHPPGPRFNTWGRDSYQVPHAGERLSVWEPELDESIDTELEPWLEAGKLQWIAPGDRALVLRTGAPGCPYLGLPGPHGFASLRYGRSF